MLRMDVNDIQPARFDQLDVAFDEQRKTVLLHVFHGIGNAGKIDYIGIVIHKLFGVAGKDVAGVPVLFKVIV